MTTVSCFNTLDNAADQVADTIRIRMEDNREQLKVIADLLAQHESQDSETIKSHLSSFRHRKTISAVGLLLPDNRLILGTDEEDTLENIFEYNTEILKAPYIFGVIDVSDGSEKKIFYQAVPVEKMGRCSASCMAL